MFILMMRKLEESRINCLSYALRFWNECPEYEIYYDSGHCINLKSTDTITGKGMTFLKAEDYGYEYFVNAFLDQLTNNDLTLLKKYFKKDLTFP